MKTESLARKQSDLVGFGQTSNIGRDAVCGYLCPTMILNPKRSSQPSYDVRNGHHQRSLPRGLSALFPAKHLSTAYGSPQIRNSQYL